MIRKLTSLCLCLTTSIYSSLSIFLLPAFAQKSLELVTFQCFSPSKESENLWTTWAWIPDKHGYVNVITWQSNHLPNGTNLQDLCTDSTKKFQTAYDQGQLERLITGTVNNKDVVCGVTKDDDKCNAQNQLFTIKPTNDPREALRVLISAPDGSSEQGPYASGWPWSFFREKPVQVTVPGLGGINKTKKPPVRKKRK